MSEIQETPLIIFRGTAKDFDIGPVVDKDGNVVDLTSRTLTFVVKLAKGDETDLISKTTGSGITVVSAAGGTAYVSIEAEDTDVDSVPATGMKAYWRLRMTSGVRVQTIGAGDLIIYA